MHPKTRAKTKEITRAVLDVVSTGLMTWASLGSPKALGKYERILGAFSGFTYSRIKETAKRLRMQDMIQYDEEDIKSPIRLTNKGMIRLAKFKLRDIFIKNKKWDYFWRIVFFDIPEYKKHIRNRLRNELLGAGFYPFQKSVYVCPFDCESVIMDFCRVYKITNNVLFCVTPSLGRKEKEVRVFFFARGKTSQKK